MASGMWDNASTEDKYNTLPAGSVAVYRSMFGSGRSARTAALKVEQSPPVSDVCWREFYYSDSGVTLIHTMFLLVVFSF